MVDWEFKDKYDLNDFIRIIDVLRAPGGCPWDIKQTHESLKRNAVEEAYESATPSTRAAWSISARSWATS